jgi:hypothetical protein
MNEPHEAEKFGAKNLTNELAICSFQHVTTDVFITHHDPVENKTITTY